MNQLIPLAVLLPFLGFVINGLFGKNLPKSVVGIIGSGVVLISFIISIILFLHLQNDPTPIHVNLINWVQLSDVNLSLGLYIDRLSVWMMLIITGIGFLIHVYSIGYMHDDSGFFKFFAFLNLFIFSMLILVMGSSYLFMFFGWEGVGLCSYLLIGFWYTNKSYSAAAMKAFVMNRIGDLGFLIAIFLIWMQFGSLEYSTVLSGGLSDEIATAIAICLFIGAVGKSAQIPLFTWLPDAMAGPTPVSALIHAATMVTAGIYLLIRSNTIFLASPIAMDIVLYIALATSLVGALIALKQNDIKKVLAYSTVSQLGLMFVALGVGAFDTALFHVTTHAFFKGLLFLGAGSVIHALSGEQDIRRMGGLRKKLPQTYWTFLIGTLAIIGFPLMSGFFSKDEILAHAYAYAPIVWFLCLVISAMTAYYMLRMFFLTFFGDFRVNEEQASHLHESPSVMTLPLWILAILSLFGGVINIPELFHGNHFLNQWLDPVLKSAHVGHEISHATEWILMFITTVVVLSILYYCYQKYAVRKAVAEEDEAVNGISKSLQQKLYFDEFYNITIVEPVQFISRVFHEYMEKGLINKTVEDTGKLTRSLSNVFRRTQDGNLEYYLLNMVIGIIVVMLCLLWF